ncbi:MAG: histidine triad nucleotide-binding protein [Candidatus Aadella gelida]|nr:histidine triad nucleotide-binding protein [Candidatus Aadella gelida]
MKENCIFCKIASKDIAASVVYEDDEILAFRDLDPQAPVHVLIIPKEHIPTVNDLSEKNEAIAGKLFSVARDIAKKEKIDKEGYRLVVNCNKNAGQEVFHMHAHLMGGRSFTWPPG